MFYMEPIDTGHFDIKSMIADYMEKGFLDNIIDMFKHDSSLYAYIGNLLTDERLVVRIGILDLVETLKTENPENLSKAMPSVIPLNSCPWLTDHSIFTT